MKDEGRNVLREEGKDGGREIVIDGGEREGGRE